MGRQRQELGKLGEELAASYLQKKGYRLLERNYRCRLGEIDIVALDGDVLVFIEVRCRTSSRFGFPQESIRREKQAKLRKLAQYYLLRAARPGPAPVTGQNQVRFDVLALLFDCKQATCRVEHIQNAF
ncbi:MAG: YraN family protein [Armatimonadetes bacterium]|nr:YraN family protein [Armatimonadota bacterium]